MSNSVQIIAPAGIVSQEILLKAQHFLEQAGIIATADEDLLGTHPFYSAVDDQRFDQLIEGVYHSAVGTLWSLRGGCGTSRMLTRLALEVKPPSPKVIIGSSDLTALHLFAYQNWQWNSIHGPNLKQLCLGNLDQKTTAQILDLVRQKHLKVSEKLTPLNDLARTTKTVSGPITGGNLSLVQRSLGTPWQVQAKDHLLFLEDINEQPYRLAEMFDHLINARVFEGVRGVLLGTFSYEKDAQEHQEYLDHVLQELADRLPIPVWGDFPVGHTKTNYPVQIGQTASILTKEESMYSQNIIL